MIALRGQLQQAQTGKERMFEELDKKEQMYQYYKASSDNLIHQLELYKRRSEHHFSPDTTSPRLRNPSSGAGGGGGAAAAGTLSFDQFVFLRVDDHQHTEAKVAKPHEKDVEHLIFAEQVQPGPRLAAAPGHGPRVVARRGAPPNRVRAATRASCRHIIRESGCRVPRFCRRRIARRLQQL